MTVLDDQAFAAVQANTPDARAPIALADTYDGAARSAHATIELRGSTSRTAIQKSYQIKLYADAGTWRGSRIINLLKHPFDLTRVRNALSFEYFLSHQQHQQHAHGVGPPGHRFGLPGPL